MDIKQTGISIKRLTSFPSCSGNEKSLAEWLKKEISPYADKVYIDNVGNLIAIRGNPKTALFCHIDKVGYMVSQIKGKNVYAVPLAKGKALPGKNKWNVLIHGSKMICGKIFELNKSTHKLALEINSDANSISVGDYITLQPNFSLDGNIIKSQGLDNKLGLFAGIEILKNCKNLLLVGTVKEEAFKLGAKVAAWKLKPKTS